MPPQDRGTFVEAVHQQAYSIKVHNLTASDIVADVYIDGRRLSLSLCCRRVTAVLTEDTLLLCGQAMRCLIPGSIRTTA